MFVAHGEMIEKNGEDSYIYTMREKLGLLGVFDGCGGIGSRKYETYGQKTGAYLASHVAAELTASWFEQFCETAETLERTPAREATETLGRVLEDGLKALEEKTEKSSVKGSLTRSFPTTASLILFYAKKDRVHASFLWAGDSRGYILTPHGLCQITKDDIDSEEDALSNITSDGRLSNLVSADEPVSLSFKSVVCSGPAIFISATDGCFGYLSTPMEFEYLLLSTLFESGSVEEWNEKLTKQMAQTAGDDYTLGIACFGCGHFQRLKRLYSARKRALYETYISKLDKTPETAKRLWEEYKKTYYRGANQ